MALYKIWQEGKEMLLKDYCYVRLAKVQFQLRSQGSTSLREQRTPFSFFECVLGGGGGGGGVGQFDHSPRWCTVDSRDQYINQFHRSFVEL